MAEHICVALVPLFEQLPLDEQVIVNNYTNHLYYDKGEEVLAPNDQRLSIIAQGKVKIYELSMDGQERLLRIDAPGDYEGADQLFVNNDLFSKKGRL